ncbi:hypothetical protein V6N13_097997 [Hibiscus sabdariffa]
MVSNCDVEKASLSCTKYKLSVSSLKHKLPSIQIEDEYFSLYSQKPQCGRASPKKIFLASNAGLAEENGHE